MRQVIRPYVPWVLALLCTHCPQGLAQEPSAAELRKLAGAISSRDPNVRSIKIRGHYRCGPCRLSFTSLYRAPDQFALRVESGAESRPLFFVSGGQMILYNPVENAVVYANPACFLLSFRSTDNRVQISVDVDNAAAPSELTVDVRSLFGCRATREHVAVAERGTFRFTRVSEAGNSLVALVDPGRRCPFGQISLIPQEEGGLELRIDEMSVDEGVDEKLPSFPSKAALVKRLPLIDWAGIENRKKDAFGILVNHFICGHLAMEDEGIRQDYEKRRGARLNWEVVKAKDRITSLATKDIVQRAFGTKK